MCGFAAVIVFSDNAPELEIIEKMGSTIEHRGPDDEGIFKNSKCALAFRRLSILDLSPAGHQPMVSSDGTFAMVFNGEIYNYLELRNELEQQGWHFKSTGDAEVLLTAYLAWGEECIKRFNGMYAFVIVNTKSGDAFAARDRAGIKPLFYARTKNAILLASESKALVVATGAPLDQARLSEYLCAGRTDAMDITSRSYFEGVFSLQAANALSISNDGIVRRSRHWEVPQESSKIAQQSDDALIKQYRDLFIKSVARQMRSDVPIGITLSGGVDSSSVACVAQDLLKSEGAKDLTYFCFHSAKFDESRFRDQIVARSKGQAIIVQNISSSFISLNRQLIKIHDEPLHSITALANAELYKAASEKGIKVLLGGQGADELLAGYPTYRNVMLRQIATERGLRSAVSDLQGNDFVLEGRRVTRTLNLMQQLTTRKLREFGILSARNQSRQAHLAAVEEGWVTTYARELNIKISHSSIPFEEWVLWGALKDAYQRRPLPDYLRIEDRNSMAFGIEARVPFLDDQLVDFSFSLPAHMKMRQGCTKYIHRQAMRGIVPDALLDRPEKFGFPVDQFSIFNPYLEKECIELIESGPLQKMNLVNFAALKNWVSRASRTEGLRALFTALQATLLVEHAACLIQQSKCTTELLLDEVCTA